MNSIQGSECPTSLPVRTAGTAVSPATGASAPGWNTRCLVVLSSLTESRHQPPSRPRCVWDQGHWGPHLFEKGR